MNNNEKIEFAEKLIELFKQAAPTEALGELANKLLWEKLV